jgi:hypothetical protein
MDSLWGTIILAGFHDGFNPCMFMTCAVFITHDLWLKKGSLKASSLSLIFAAAYALGSLMFNFGRTQVLVLQKDFIFSAKILYFVLGVWAFVSGAFFFRDWLLLSQGRPVDEGKVKDFKPSPAFIASACLTTGFLGVVSSALATVWPVDKYVVLLGNTAMMNGKWPMVMPMAAGYIVISMWPLWVVWAFLSIKNLRPSLLKIVCSSVFFTAASCVVLIFK